MSRNRSDKYDESVDSSTVVRPEDLVEIDYDSIFHAPIPLPKYAGRVDPNKRQARGFSPQLVILAVDDSRSMSHDGKAEAATNAVKDMLAEMVVQCDGSSDFDVVVFSFGTYVNYDKETFGVPILDFPADSIDFAGTSDRTKYYRALWTIEAVLQHYEKNYLRFHEMPKAHPVPLVIFMSDGFDKAKNHDPIPIADRIKTMKLSIGAPPLILTVGIEFGGDQPDVNLLKRLASIDDESNRPAYFDVSNASMLAQFLSKAASSGSSTAAEIFRAVGDLERKRRPR
nr:vWA domain-containing protein [Rhodopirellula bahusiensis]